jgi:hypothetical protein
MQWMDGRFSLTADGLMADGRFLPDGRFAELCRRPMLTADGRWPGWLMAGMADGRRQMAGRLRRPMAERPTGRCIDGHGRTADAFTAFYRCGRWPMAEPGWPMPRLMADGHG